MIHQNHQHHCEPARYVKRGGPLSLYSLHVMQTSNACPNSITVPVILLNQVTTRTSQLVFIIGLSPSIGSLLALSSLLIPTPAALLGTLRDKRAQGLETLGLERRSVRRFLRIIE